MKSIALCTLAALIPLWSHAQGKIEVVGPDSVGFGKYDAWEKRIARYTIRNAGTKNLRIVKIRKTCGCASAKCNKTELEPNQQGTVEVVILPDSIFGPYSKNTFVESTDPDMRFLKLAVSGEAIPLVVVEPQSEVNLGRIPDGKEAAQSFVLKATGEHVVLGEPVVKGNYPIAAIISPADSRPHGEFRLHVASGEIESAGDLQCEVAIPVVSPTNHSPVKVSVTARIGAELQVLPGILRIPLSDVPVSRSLQLRVLGQRSRVLDPVALMLPDAETVQFRVEQHRDGHSLLATATFQPEFTKQLLADEKTPLRFAVPNAASTKLVCKIRR